MSRGRSERKADRLELDHRRPADPFSEMHQIMRSFGGLGSFGSDFFGDSLMRDPIEEMMDFSRAHRGLQNAGKEGSYVCQTYVSSSTMGPDGKLKNHSYFQNSAGQHKNGQTISQKQQAYKNNDGVRKIAEERMLNDQGRKIVRQKRGNEAEEVTNHYYNLDETEAGRFDQNWRGANQELKFLESHQKYLQGLTNNGHQRQLGLGYEPRREQSRGVKQNQKTAIQPSKGTNYKEPVYKESQQERKSQFQESVQGSSKGQSESRGNMSQKGSSYKSGLRGQY